jgi:hypothetical protein
MWTRISCIAESYPYPRCRTMQHMLPLMSTSSDAASSEPYCSRQTLRQKRFNEAYLALCLVEGKVVVIQKFIISLAQITFEMSKPPFVVDLKILLQSRIQSDKGHFDLLNAACKIGTVFFRARTSIFEQ